MAFPAQDCRGESRGVGGAPGNRCLYRDIRNKLTPRWARSCPAGLDCGERGKVTESGIPVLPTRSSRSNWQPEPVLSMLLRDDW